jgi:hypothetical protein
MLEMDEIGLELLYGLGHGLLDGPVPLSLRQWPGGDIVDQSSDSRLVQSAVLGSARRTGRAEHMHTHPTARQSVHQLLGVTLGSGVLAGGIAVADLENSHARGSLLLRRKEQGGYSLT